MNEIFFGFLIPIYFKSYPHKIKAFGFHGNKIMKKLQKHLTSPSHLTIGIACSVTPSTLPPGCNQLAKVLIQGVPSSLSWLICINYNIRSKPFTLFVKPYKYTYINQHKKKNKIQRSKVFVKELKSYETHIRSKTLVN